MFDPSFFNFEFFNFVLMASSLAPLFGDIEAWLPDFGKWLGPQVQKVIDGIKLLGDFLDEKIKAIIGTVIDAIKAFFDSLYNFLKEAWEWIKAFFTSILNAIDDALEFVKECISQGYEFIQSVVDEFWDLLGDTWEAFCDWLISWFWYWLEYEFELALSYADWLVGFSHDILYKILEKLPPIQLPAAFEEGLTYFISYGMILNQIIPIKEGLMLFELYVTVYVALIVHSYVKGWYRWIGWFNR